MQSIKSRTPPLFTNRMNMIMMLSTMGLFLIGILFDVKLLSVLMILSTIIYYSYAMTRKRLGNKTRSKDI